MTLSNSTNEKVFDLYKPLRNYTRKLNLNESLLGIHAHMQFQQFNQQLPNYIQGFPWGYNRCNRFVDFMTFHMFPWEMAILTKEVIINSQKYGSKKSILHWHFLSESINKLKSLEDSISGIYVNKNNVLSEMHRITHRQFKWQHPPNMNTIARYFVIFNDLKLNEIIKNKIGLSIEKIYLLGIVFIGFFLQKIALNYPPKIEIKNLDLNELNLFLKHFSIDFERLREKLITEQEYNEKFAYSYSSLTAYPLIRMEYGNMDSLVCPVPRYLYERFTSGIYYEIYKEKNFDNAFGESFQNYVGEVLKRTHDLSKIYSEKSYGNDTRTIDWALSDHSSILFIECKTKRLTLNAKVELESNLALDNQLEKIADFVIQTYKTIIEYTKGKYPNLKYDQSKNIYPLIVTLEDWYIFGNDIPKINKKIEEKLLKQKLPQDLMIKYPYSVCSAETFETFSQIIKQVGINKVMEGKTKNKETVEWEMLTYLQGFFKKEILNTKNIFKDITESFFDKYEAL